MKKNIILIILLLLFGKVHAQQQLSIGLNAGGPNSGYRFLVAPDLRYQFSVTKHFTVPLTVGYTQLKPNFITQEKGATTYQFIPVKAGLKYFFNDNGTGAYGLLEAGAAFNTQSNGQTAFVFSPAIGYAWNNGLDLAAKYEGYSATGNMHYIGIRLGYGIKL